MVQDNPVIALVDDDEELRRGLAKFLERENFTVRHGVSCEDARALAQAADVDLMVLDRLLPDGDSVHAASDIRSQTDIPIIILSGVGQTSERVIGLDAGADDYIPKPVSPSELVARIRVVRGPAVPLGGRDRSRQRDD